MPHNKICLYQITDSQHCRHIFQEYFLHILQEMLSNPNYFCNFASPNKVAGCSSVRFRVLVWGASGRKFESCHPDNGTDYQSNTISVLFYYTYININNSYVAYQSITINYLSAVGSVRPRMRLNTHRPHPHALRMGARRYCSPGYP